MCAASIAFFSSLVKRSFAVRSSTGYFWISPSGYFPSLNNSTMGIVGGLVWPYWAPALAGLVPMPKLSFPPAFFLFFLRFFFFLSPDSGVFSSSSESSLSSTAPFSLTSLAGSSTAFAFSGSAFSDCFAEI